MKTLVNMYYNFNFGIGFNDKDSKKQELTTEEIKKTIEDLTIEYLGFWTLSDINKWVYTYEDWVKQSEYSVNVNFKTQSVDWRTINGYVKSLKKALNQESILVSYTMENVQFL